MLIHGDISHIKDLILLIWVHVIDYCEEQILNLTWNIFLGAVHNLCNASSGEGLVQSVRLSIGVRAERCYGGEGRGLKIS